MPNNTKKEALIETILKNLPPEDQTTFYAVTYTLKQWKVKDYIFESCTQQQNRIFSNISKSIDRVIYKSAVKYGNRVFSFAVFEQGKGRDQRWHIHMLIGIPNNRTMSDSFDRVLEGLKERTGWLREQRDCQQVTSLDGWVKYILKDQRINDINLDLLRLPRSTDSK